MITLITRSNIDECYPIIAPGLTRALTKTTLGKYWDLESLYHHIVNFEAYAFHQVESGYSGVFSIGGAPLGKTLFFFWSGKDKHNKTPVDYAEINSVLEESAKHFGCAFIQCEGRRGWKPVLEPLGYVEDSTNFVKEVGNELSPI